MKGRSTMGLVCLVMASCTTKVQPFPELPPGLDAAPEAAPDGAASDPATDAPPLADGIAEDTNRDPAPEAADPGGPEEVPGLPDGILDGTVDIGTDGPREDTASDACEPVSCGLWCEFGFAQDAQGCPICACRDCAQDDDCNGRLAGCPKAFCAPEGTCQCDCSGYEEPRYTCPDGSMVPHCRCTDQGISCIDHPEWQCPTLCRPGTADMVPCPDGSRVPWCTCEQDLGCVPDCQEVDPGSGAFGWRNPCTQEFLRKDPPCTPGQGPVCSAIGTRSEGWRDDAGLIAFSQCGPRRNCVLLATDTCVGGRCTSESTPGLFQCPGGLEVPFCSCNVPGADCVPECLKDGVGGWQWVNPCTGKPIMPADCSRCDAICLHIGTRSEGWYSSCDEALITYAMCGSGTWTCAPDDPWNACRAP
ncbi:MAG TPA: hypothetical protein PLQ97_11485 [Myxococcota bacterium]|nr:hypothetical protein [Myxococcota bacterium]HQK51770.1 hypothetical protein [Myxococcota bacterium]